jgi:type IV secretion system protein VirD4
MKKLKRRSDTFNPLDGIAASSPEALDECRDLAEAVVIRTGEEKDPHWNDTAEAVIASVIATVVQYGLLDVSSPDDLRRCLKREYPDLAALFREWAVD